MKYSLSENWITEGLIDFEFKKYTLLAYFQGVNSLFKQNKLYPVLSDLVLHYQNLISIKEQKRLFQQNLPKEISKADLEKLELVYKELAIDDQYMHEIEQILEFSIPTFKTYLEQGKDIYQFVEESIEISPIGLTPIHPEAGYFFLVNENTTNTQVYEFQITLFQNATENLRGLHVAFVENFSRNLVNTYEAYKINLVKKQMKYGNPATYLIAAKKEFPITETLLPVAKRTLVKYLTTA